MDPQTRQRFSFSQQAAAKPQRQRFSFSQSVPQGPDVDLRDPLGVNQFIARASTPTPKTGIARLRERDMSQDTISQAPERTLLQKAVELLRERQPSRATPLVKDVAQGTLRDVTSLFTPGKTITPTTPNQRILFGDKPFNLETVGREYASVVGKEEDIGKKTAVTIGIFGGILSLPAKGLGLVKSSSKTISKLDDVGRIKNEFKKLGVKGSDEELDALAKVFRAEKQPQVIEDTLRSFVKRGKAPARTVPTKTTPTRTFSRMLDDAPAARQTPTPTTRVLRVADEAPAAPVRQLRVGETPTKFSFAKQADETATVRPVVQAAEPTAPTVSPARSVAEAPGPIARNQQISEANTLIFKQKTLKGLNETERLTQPKVLARARDAEVLPKNVTPESEVTVFRASDGPISAGDQITTSRQRAETYIAQRPNAKIQSSKVKVKDLVQTPGVNNEFIYAPKAKIAEAPAAPTRAIAARSKQLADDVEETKAWNADPIKAQADSTKEVAKKYSNTDSTKGFINDAVNKIDGLPPVKNATAKARNFSKSNDVPIELPPDTVKTWLLSNIQDTAYRLGFLQKKLTQAGVKISDEANAYVQREAYIGRAAARIEKNRKALGMQAGSPNGLLVRMQKDNISIDVLDEYMRAKAAKARNARVATISKGKVPDGGSGLTNKQAEEILKKYEGNTAIAGYAKELREMVITPRLQLLKDFGLLDDAKIAQITKFEPDYVPFKVAEFDRIQGGGKGFSVGSTGVKGLRGSARVDRTNVVMQAIVDYEDAIMRAEKNKSLQSLAKLMRENPDSSLWEIKGIKHLPQYNEAGELQFLRKQPINERTSVEFFEDGVAKEIRFHDPELAKVFTQEGVVKPIASLRVVNNYLRAVNTFINPEFMITNALRDLQTATVIAGGEKGLVTAAKMVKDYPQASKGIWQAVRKGSNTGWAKTYNEMVEAGGRTGWFDLKEVGEQTKEVSRLVKRYNSSQTSDSLMKAIDSTGKLISDVNEAAEMSVRVSAYKQLVDGGMSKTLAANYAKNMTVNFNKRGNLGMMMNSLYLFSNAGIQGTARIVTAMKYPKVRRIVYGIVGSSFALNELNNKINPEGYSRIQDFEKERNLIVMLPLDGNKYNLPGVSGDPGNGYYFKIPLPYGFNVFKVAGDVAYDRVTEKKTSAESMKQLLLSIDAAFNPLSSGTPIQFISPTVSDPFISSWENKNWFGAPIMPEQPAFAPQVRDSDRYFSGARDISVTTAQFLNRLTGGNEVTAGAVDISPETVDHIIDTLGGGLGNFLAQSADGAVNVVKGDIPTPDEMPFVRKLIDTPFETGEQSQVFELLERSATNRMSEIEIKRFADNAIGALKRGQIGEDTAKRVLKDFINNAARQEAGEVLSLLKEGNKEKALEVIRNAPPQIAKELEKLIRDDLEREIKRLQREQQ